MVVPQVFGNVAGKRAVVIVMGGDSILILAMYEVEMPFI